MKYRLTNVSDDLLKIIGFKAYYNKCDKCWYEYFKILDNYDEFNAVVYNNTLTICHDTLTMPQLAEFNYIYDNLEPYIIKDLTNE